VALSHEDGMSYTVVAGRMTGGIIAAPFAAWLVRKLPPRLLGAAAGGLIVFTNTRTLLSSFDASSGLTVAVLAAVVVLWAVALTAAVRSIREERRINRLAGETDGEHEAEPAQHA